MSTPKLKELLEKLADEPCQGHGLALEEEIFRRVRKLDELIGEGRGWIAYKGSVIRRILDGIE